MDIKVDKNTILVFDLDDTLYNELEYLKSAYIYIAKKLEPLDWKPLFVSMFSKYRCNLDVFSELSNRYNIEKTELITYYREHFPNIKPFPGVVELFTSIKRNKGIIGIITDGRAKTQRNKIEALGLTPYIDHCVISEEVGTEKPCEENYRIMERKFGPGNYYYLADNLKKDFITPNALGWNTMGILDNGLNIHPHAHMYWSDSNKPIYFFESFNELRVLH